MAEAVAEAIADCQQLVVEAGTGTGKTFAYLLPALMSGRKTIISTGTKALQDQLYHRDLPLIGKVVGRPVSTALLKGRANYLCLQRLDMASGQATSATHVVELRAVNEWRHRTRTGDRAELTEVAEDSSVWPLVTSTADNCLGSQCPLYQKCHVVKARRAAQEADLVVVNHHLLLADLAMKEEGFVEFLPGAEAVILDEAHQIPDLAAQFFGVSLGSRELERMLSELRIATAPFGIPDLLRQLDDVQTAIRVLRADAPRQEGRHEMSAVQAKLREPLRNLGNSLRGLLDTLNQLTDSSVEVEKLYEQLLSAIEKLSHLADDDSWDGLRWIEVNARSLRLNLTPLDVADTLGSLFTSGVQSWIFTSATLAIGEDFGHFVSRMGIPSATTLTFPSPYALAEHGLIWLPAGLPEPSDKNHTAEMLDQVLPLLHATSGGMFCLFTSHRALNAARKWLSTRKKRLNGRPLLVQGDAPRDDLLRRFREYGNAVLLGTGSFWEGVDVPGPALQAVIVVKFPFDVPSDPIFAARSESFDSPFYEYSIPEAVLRFRQGFGRLIRRKDDQGVVIVLDKRILTKRYGQAFLDALPECTILRQRTDRIGELSLRWLNRAKE